MVGTQQYQHLNDEKWHEIELNLHQNFGESFDFAIDQM